MSWYFDPETKVYKTIVADSNVTVGMDHPEGRSIITAKDLEINGLIVLNDHPTRIIGSAKKLEVILTESIEQEDIPNEVRTFLTDAVAYLSSVIEKRDAVESHAERNYFIRSHTLH